MSGHSVKTDKNGNSAENLIGLDQWELKNNETIPRVLLQRNLNFPKHSLVTIFLKKKFIGGSGFLRMGENLS